MDHLNIRSTGISNYYEPPEAISRTVGFLRASEIRIYIVTNVYASTHNDIAAYFFVKLRQLNEIGKIPARRLYDS